MLNARWNNFTLRGQRWDHFWQDGSSTASSPTEVQPGTGQITLAGFAPGVVATDNKNLFPDFGVLALSGFAPTIAVTQNVTVSPGTGELTLTAFFPGAFGDSLRGTFKKRLASRSKRSFGWSRR